MSYIAGCIAFLTSVVIHIITSSISVICKLLARYSLVNVNVYFTVGGFVLLIVLMAVPVTMITIGKDSVFCVVVMCVFLGIVFVNDCPFQPFIPIYLIVAGILGITKNIAQIGEKLLIPSIKRKMTEQTFKKCYRIWKVVNILYTFLMFTCLVVGSYYIYSNYGKLNNSGNYRSDLCHEGLYKFAFGITTASFILATLLICCLCCCGLCQVHDHRNVSTQRRHRLNNETNQTNTQVTTNSSLNPISNQIQNGHHPISESTEETQENITPQHTNHINPDMVSPSTHSNYTQETIV